MRIPVAIVGPRHSQLSMGSWPLTKSARKPSMRRWSRMSGRPLMCNQVTTRWSSYPSSMLQGAVGLEASTALFWLKPGLGRRGGAVSSRGRFAWFARAKAA
jgi:hypothetical protein